MRTLSDRVGEALRYSAQLDHYLRQQFVADRVERAADRAGAGPLHRFFVNTTGRVVSGRVVEAVGGVHWYKVQVDGARQSVACGMLGAGTLGPVGARPLALLRPGAEVYLVQPPGSPVGWILGAVPPAGLDPRIILPDQVALAGRCGIAVDPAHNYQLRLARSGDVSNYSAGRPIDSLPGDWGAMAETGVAVFADSFMAYLRANEDTGVWAFLEDDLLRVAGHNLQVRSAGVEEEHLDDAGEFLWYRGTTPFPAWEGLGSFDRAVPAVRVVPSAASQVETPHYAAVEPVHDDQQPFHRVQEYGGYVGGLYTRFVAAPPARTGFHRLSGRAPVAGLFAEHVGPDGAWSVTSARGVGMRLTPALPVPRRTRRPEDPAGDAAPGYRAAGVYGAGAAAPPPLDPVVPAEPGAAVADPADRHAFARWATVTAFSHHVGDFYVPPEAAVPHAPTVPPPEYTRLRTETYLAGPVVRRVWLGEAFGEAAVPLCAAHIDILADGNISIGGGGGEYLRTVNGSVEIGCPGDVTVRPGRRFVVLAGKDAVVKARQSVDVSATRGDLRLKARNNLQAVSTRGGVLVESRNPAAAQDYAGTGEAVAAAGVVLKSAGVVGLLGTDVYLRAAESGTVTLDAGAGTGALREYAASAYRYVAGEAVDFFGVSGPDAGEPASVNRFSAAAGLVGSPLGVVGPLAVDGQVVAAADVVAAGGRFACRGGGPAADLDGDSAGQADAFVAGLGREFEADGVARGEADFAAFKAAWYAPGRLGDAATAARVGFSFRSEAEYGTADYFLWEAVWERQARVGGAGLDAWAEEPVAAGAADTYPFPGPARTTEAGGYLQLDETLTDPATGHGRPASDPAWAAPAAGAVRRAALQDSYPVTG